MSSLRIALGRKRDSKSLQYFSVFFFSAKKKAKKYKHLSKLKGLKVISEHTIAISFGVPRTKKKKKKKTFPQK